jgi:hypothetical protein
MDNVLLVKNGWLYAGKLGYLIPVDEIVKLFFMGICSVVIYSFSACNSTGISPSVFFVFDLTICILTEEPFNSPFVLI